MGSVHRMRSRPARWLAVLVLWAVGAAVAGAHGTMIGAYATLTPARPGPGQPVQLDLDVVDPLNNPMPQLKLRAEVVPAGQPSRAPGQPLQEVSPGRYRGSVTFPAAGQYSIALQAEVQGAIWQGELPVMVGGQGVPVENAGVALLPNDDHSGQPATGSGWLWAAAGGSIALFAVALWLLLRTGARIEGGN